MLGITAALNRPHELRVHALGALATGCTAEEMREILLLVAVYCGIPAANDAHRVVYEVLQEKGAV
jgi:4-carboxymuconolactone decarboxylase